MVTCSSSTTCTRSAFLGPSLLATVAVAAPGGGGRKRDVTRMRKGRSVGGPSSPLCLFSRIESPARQLWGGGSLWGAVARCAGRDNDS